MNTDKLDVVDIFDNDDNDDNDDKSSNDNDNDITIEAENMNKEEIVQDTYIVDRNNIIIKKFNDIPFLNSDASILKFTEEQAHNEIFNLTENFNFKNIFKEITDIENNSLQDKSIIDTFLRSKWFYPIAKFKKNRMDYDFENIENIETDNYKQTSLLSFLKKLKEFKYSPVYITDKQNYKIPEDTQFLWEHSINDDTKVTNYIEERQSSKSLIWDEEDLKEYIENLWHNYDDEDISVNDDKFLESKRILEYKRMLKNENMLLTGIFINNNSKHYYHLFDIDEYFSKLENIVSFPVDASLNSNNTVKNVQIIAKKNNVLTFKNADNTEELYDLTNPPSNKLLYLKDGGYSYVYSKKDFYDENIIFITNKYNFLEIAHIVIPDIYDFFTINKSTDYTTINKKLNYFHNTTIEKLHEYSFTLFKNSYKYKPEKKDSIQIEVKNYKSSFESTYDILNKKEIAKTNLTKRFDDKILTKMDSNMRRFNLLESFKDKGIDIIYHLHVLKFIKYIVSLKPMENINDDSESFKLKDINDIDKIKEMKKKYLTNGKTNFDDYNRTINKLDTIKSDILNNFKENISFMNSKHHVPYKSIRSEGNTTKEIKETTYEDVVLNVDLSMYDIPTEFEQPQISPKNNDDEAKIILSLGMKANASQLEALLTYYRKHINVLESQQDNKPLPDKSKMIILFTWVLIFTQIIDKSFIKKELIDDCMHKYSIGGYPINDLDQTDNTEIFKNNKDKSLIGYLTCVFMYKNNISNIPYQKVMFEIIKRVRDVFKLYPYLKNKLKDVHELKNSKHKKFEVTKSYVKMFKPFNQNLSDIDLSKTKIDRTTKSKENIFNVTKAIKFKKPIESMNISKPEGIVHTKSKANIKDFSKKEITLDDFIKENEWIDADTIQSIYDDKNEYALSEYIEKLFSTYMEFNNNSDLRKYYEDAITNKEDISVLLQENFNVYFSDVSNTIMIGKNISYLFKFSKQFHESSIFNATFENSLRKNIITKLDILKQITDSDKRKKQIFVAILLSSLLNIINENFDKDENGNYINQDINIFNNFINDSFNHKIKQKIIINKDELKRKYNLLRSEERSKERSTINEMTDENIDLYFAYKKIGLESSGIQNINQSEGATYDQDVDYGDGDGDFQIFNDNNSL